MNRLVFVSACFYAMLTASAYADDLTCSQAKDSLESKALSRVNEIIAENTAEEQELIVPKGQDLDATISNIFIEEHKSEDVISCTGTLTISAQGGNRASGTIGFDVVKTEDDHFLWRMNTLQEFALYNTINSFVEPAVSAKFRRRQREQQRSVEDAIAAAVPQIKRCWADAQVFWPTDELKPKVNVTFNAQGRIGFANFVEQPFAYRYSPDIGRAVGRLLNVVRSCNVTLTPQQAQSIRYKSTIIELDITG